MTTRRPELVLLTSAPDEDAAYAMVSKLQDRHIVADVLQTRDGWWVRVDPRHRERAQQILG